MAIRMNFGYVNNINERGDNSDFNIYPNPTNGLFIISTNNNEPCDIIITNLLGQEIIQLTNNGFDPISVDLNNHESGIYTVKLLYGDKVSTKSIIIQ